MKKLLPLLLVVLFAGCSSNKEAFWELHSEMSDCPNVKTTLVVEKGVWGTTLRFEFEEVDPKMFYKKVDGVWVASNKMDRVEFK